MRTACAHRHISNWHDMSEEEQQATREMAKRRNAKRIAQLKAEGKGIAGLDLK